MAQTIIDLTVPIFPDMPVYPGDPTVEFEQVLTFTKDHWNMLRVHLNLHDGTHVNVPLNGVAGGKSLDDYHIKDFQGEAVVYEREADITASTGVLFIHQNISMAQAHMLARIKPRFVGLAKKFVFDEAVERYLLEQGILSYENLANTERLPKHFFFYGVPLPFRNGDGSPVRAFAVYETQS